MLDWVALLWHELTGATILSREITKLWQAILDLQDRFRAIHMASRNKP